MHSRHNVIVCYTRTICWQDHYHNHSATQMTHCTNQSHTRTSGSVSHYTPIFILSTFYTSYKVEITLKPFWFCFEYIGAIYFAIKPLFLCIIALKNNSYFRPRKQYWALLSSKDVVYIGGGKTEGFRSLLRRLHHSKNSNSLPCFQFTNILLWSC
jgi:hypothetical protein